MQILNYQQCTLTIGFICAVILLSACKGAQEATGWHRTAPDAASIQPLRALEIPPGFQNVPSDHPDPTKLKGGAPHTPALPSHELDRAEASLLEHVQPPSQ